MSAFNIVLGEVFDFQENLYMAQSQFFRKVDQDAKLNDNNSTTTVSSDVLDMEM